MSQHRDEEHHRALLEAAQAGLENGKGFIQAIASSSAAARDVTVRSKVEGLAKRLDDLKNETDQLWDLFKRAQ
jgi:hypothetical protein